MIIFIAFVTQWYAALFFQTFFQHRYAAHRAFEMNRSWERLFFVLTYVAQGPSYMSPATYAIMHRMHHAYADTEQDPHSPSHCKNIVALMWRAHMIYQAIYDKTIIVDRKFTKDLPEWKRFEVWCHSILSRVLWLVAYVLFFLQFASSAWLYLILPVMVAMGPLQGVIINWFAHTFGYINFKQKNSSRNLFWLDLIMLGESYHNNHHKSPSRANFGRRWHEIDPVFIFIRFLHSIRVVRIIKPQL